MGYTAERLAKVRADWYHQPIGEHQVAYQGGLIGPQHRDYLRRQQIAWGLSYIDARYGTRRSRARRHLRQAVHHVRLAVRELVR